MANSEYNQLITDTVRTIIEENYPHEIHTFSATSEAHFRNPRQVLKYRKSKDPFLGIGATDIVAAVTPALLFVTNEVVMYLVEEAKKVAIEKSTDAILTLVKQHFKSKKKENGIFVPLTIEQMKYIHKLSYDRFLYLKISEKEASRLANDILASMITEAGEKESAK
jgi:hypothetical protein